MDTELAYTPVTRAYGHSYKSQYIVLTCCTAAQTRSETKNQGGGDFAAGNFRHGIFESALISHAVLKLLWEISHPHAVSQLLVGGG